VMSFPWMSVMYYWGDHGSMTEMWFMTEDEHIHLREGWDDTQITSDKG
jgi:hypothetical protein